LLPSSPLSSPRLLDYGSSTRGGSGLCSPARGKPEYDVARFFTARDLVDLINNLYKAAKIAGDEESSLHGDEQANRVKAKCSKVCGLSNRLIDLYVATIKAKVARILRKLGLGQEKGQELLYHHLGLLQTLVDQAFGAFNAVQQAEAARIKQAKTGNDVRRENSATLTWRTPAERRPSFRPGSHGSLPQPVQHLDIKDLLEEAHKQFTTMAEELLELKIKLVAVDRARLQEAVVAAEAEGEVPDPLPKIKPTADFVAYGFCSRYTGDSNGGVDFVKAGISRTARDAISSAQSRRTSRLVRSTETSPAVTPQLPLPLTTAAYAEINTGGSRSPRGVSEPGQEHGHQVHVAWPFSPLRTGGSGVSGKHRKGVSDTGEASRGVLRTPPKSPIVPRLALHRLVEPHSAGKTVGGHSPLGAAESGYGSGSQASGAGLTSPSRSSLSCTSAKQRSAIDSGDASHGGQKTPTKGAVFRRQQSRSKETSAEVNGHKPPVLAAFGRCVPSSPAGHASKITSPSTVSGRAMVAREGAVVHSTTTPTTTSDTTPPPLHHAPDTPLTFDTPRSEGPRGYVPTSAEAASDGFAFDEALPTSGDPYSDLKMQLQARTTTTEILSLQAARFGEQLVHLEQEKEDVREGLRELTLEALRLVLGDHVGLGAALHLLGMSHEQLEASAALCESGEATIAELQMTLRTCLQLLGHQLRPAQYDLPLKNSISGALSSHGDGDAPCERPICARCSELAALLDQLLPLLSAAATGDHIVTADFSLDAPRTSIPVLAADGSHDE
ncbi:hypothetical protein Agub_g12381, partial [Astrephomene gubernaculifera]